MVVPGGSSGWRIFFQHFDHFTAYEHLLGETWKGRGGGRFDEFREMAEIPASEYFENYLVYFNTDFPTRCTKQWERCVLV